MPTLWRNVDVEELSEHGDAFVEKVARLIMPLVGLFGKSAGHMGAMGKNLVESQNPKTLRQQMARRVVALAKFTNKGSG